MFKSKVYNDNNSDKSDNERLMECHDDHIYENATNRYKYKILNEIISSFTSKARDLKLLARKRDKHIHNISSNNNNDCPSTMNEHDLNSSLTQFNDDMSIFERNFELQMDYENSYTSCEDDNIYENLEFFIDESFNNTSLNNWILNLTHDVAEYDTENIMFVKSIPSVFSVKRKEQKNNFHRNHSNNKNEITLKFLKILWNGENNVDIMSLLLQTFSNLLRDQNKQRQSASCISTDCSSFVTKSTEEKVSFKKLKKSKKKIDKRIYQKFENVILSSSLNILVITYNKSQKFYFILAYSEILVKLPTSVNPSQIIHAIRNHFTFNFQSKSYEREFYIILRRMLCHKLKELRDKTEEVEVENDKSAIEINNSENIYQQIWTCQSIANVDKGVIINSENIYSSLDYARAYDDNEWEVDHEFSFMNPKILISDEKMMSQSDYKTIWVYYNDDNPEYNQIVYDLSLMDTRLNLPKDTRNDESLYSEVMSVPNDVNKYETPQYEIPSIEISKVDAVPKEIPQNCCESIEAWKTLLRSPYYCEDEEDFIVNESVLSSNFTYYNDAEDESFQSVTTVHSSSFSLQLDDSLSINPSLESYKILGEDVVIQEKSLDSPKKERFRDKVRSKLKIRSGKLIIEGKSTESIASNIEDDSEKFLIFGCNLEKIEKDNYHKDIPKIIVECINILELDINIKTPGIYRISGNKNTIDAIKKKFNEKKQSKKESRNAFLQAQDVHTLTGLLKMFFRELKPPLMTKQIFTQCTSEKHSASSMGKILREMPLQNYATLKFLFKHLKTIEKYQDENLMSSGNIAICLGLCLFSNSFGEAPNPFDSDISKCNTLCKYLIDNYSEVFERNDEAS